MKLVQDFTQAIPPEFRTVISILHEHQWCLRFVGGIIRHFVQHGQLDKDWDAEIMSMDGKVDYDDLVKVLRPLGQLSQGAYRVLTIKFESGMALELAPARIEHFSANLGHKNFEAEWAVGLAVGKTFERRDFTMNAMAISFYPDQAPQWEDPFHGEKHLREKKLVACSLLFDKDPVRVLRAFRFKTDYGLDFDSTLEHLLKKMNLDSVSVHYWKSEFSKSKNWRLMASELTSFYQGDADWHHLIQDSLEPKQLHPRFEVDVLLSLSQTSDVRKLAHWWEFSMKRAERWANLFEGIKNSPVWLSDLDTGLPKLTFEEISLTDCFNKAHHFFKVWQELSGEMEDEGIILIDLIMANQLDPEIVVKWRKMLRLSFILVNPNVAEGREKKMRSTYIFYHRLKLSFSR